MPDRRRVVITGVGAVTPLGSSVGALWDGLVSARSGIAPIRHFDSAPFDVHFGGYCTDFDPESFFDKRQIRRLDRFAQLALAAAFAARDDSGLTPGSFDPARAGVILGTGIGGINELEEQHLRLIEKGPGRVSAFTIPKLMANAGAGHISIELGLQAVNTAVATACASAGNAMCDALNTIRHGYAEVIYTGGAEAALSPLGLAAFAAMKALSTRNDDPQAASRPFDKDRDGFVLSEGSGMVVFEEYEHAKRRNAKIYCEVIGCGATADAGDMVQPEPEGRGAARAMQMCLADAGIRAAEVDYINAHGTSTPLGDVAETRAIKRVFGDHAAKLLVSSTKSAIGHTLGASGGIEVIACIKALEHRVAPPTINLAESDPGCDLDYVPNHARDANIRVTLNNSFGFGGHNACLLLRRIG